MALKTPNDGTRPAGPDLQGHHVAFTSLPDHPYRYDYSSIDLTQPATGTGIWRWNALLPVDGSASYPLRVGGTPLTAPPILRQVLDVPGLVLKDETFGPSGSNKDRATALCVSDALSKGVRTIACASSGNVATSLAVGAAAVGMQAVVFVPKDAVSASKVALMRHFGALVCLVESTYEEAYRLSEEACERFGWYSRNTGSNPLAIEGKKTVAFEVWEQLGGRMPDVAFIQVGDGVTLAAFVHGCTELLACGVIDTLPRVVGVQAEGASPLARVFPARSWVPVPVETVADGLGVGDPFFGAAAMDGVAATGGEFVAISDHDMLEAIKLLALSAGMTAEAAGAAALAAAIQHARDGKLDGVDSVLALVTGTGLKDHRWINSSSGGEIDTPPDVEALAHRLDAAGQVATQPAAVSQPQA